MKRLVLLFAFCLIAAPVLAAPLPIRMVVVTTFQHGEDGFGEMKAWLAEATVKLPFAAGDVPLRYDPARGLLVIATGMGSPHAAASIMALGTDARFDLSKAYWLVAAIAGVDPAAGSLGSAAWIGDVIDGDYGFEIDARETPSDWPTGKLPWFRATPYALPVPDTADNLFALNTQLRDWAFNLTKDITLPDSDALAQGRKGYAEPAALRPPFVLTGSEISGQSWWAGWTATRHARRWTDYWTSGKGRFVMSAMEDSGILRAVGILGRMGRADPARVMVLRTASDYTAPPPGTNAPDYIAAIQKQVPATREALAAAYLVGKPVVTEITGHWTTYESAIPAN
jgi:purine nucleoside permease